MEISRRNFLKLGGIFGAGSLLPACAKESVLRPAEEKIPPKGRESFVHSVCGMCPAGCGMRVRKVDGHAVGVSGALDHPINLGSLCPKGVAVVQELYHPDRVRRPLLREGARGAGKWTEVSWAEAVRRIAEKLSGAKRGKNAPALAVLTDPQRRDVHRELLGELAGSFGENNVFALNFPMSEPPVDAYRSMHGSPRITCDPARCQLLVSFGFDWLQAHPSPVEAQRLYGRLRRRDAGRRAHLVQIESRFSVTAAKADAWIPIRPGTEGLLALGLARQLIAGGNYDKAFVEKHARGFESFRKSVEPFSPERVSEATGVSEKDMRLLTVKLFSSRPAAAIAPRGPLFDQMAVHSLNALLGNIGTDEVFSAGGADQEHGADSPDAGAAAPEVLLVDRVNPLFIAPGRWQQFLEKTPFVVTISPFPTETAEFSDLVLPCHTPLEQLHCSRHRSLEGKSVLNAAPGAVEPLHDTKNPGEIFRMIRQAAAGEAEREDFPLEFAARAEKWGAADLLQEENPVRWREPAEPAGRDRAFSTPSGRFEFDALSTMIDARAVVAAGDGDFPLWLHVFTPLPFFRGEGAHLPYLKSVAGIQTHEVWETWAEIHPATAQKHGIADGAPVWIESRRGRITAKARLLPAAMPEVVSVPFGLGHTAYGRWADGAGSNPAEIVETTEAGGGFAATPVRIGRG